MRFAWKSASQDRADVCLAVLTAAGWSAFSYPSRPVHVKQRPGLMDGILSLVLPPEAARRPFLLPAIGPAGTLDTGEQVSQA
ncbi:Pla2g12a, partial [Symbiodinium microadriaticum]